MSSKKKPTAARRAVPLKAAKPASASSKAKPKTKAATASNAAFTAQVVDALVAGFAKNDYTPERAAELKPQEVRVSTLTLVIEPAAAEAPPAAAPLSPSQQLLANAIDGYEAARADTERAAAVLKAAVEAERLAQQRIDEAAGAHAASKNEQLQSRDALCKALNEQAPGQLIARKGRHYIASGQLLREFDAPQSL